MFARYLTEDRLAAKVGKYIFYNRRNINLIAANFTLAVSIDVCLAQKDNCNSPNGFCEFTEGPNDEEVPTCVCEEGYIGDKCERREFEWSTLP